MSFAIEFLDEPRSYPYDDASTPAGGGVLTLGKDKEYFLASLHEWDKSDYTSQWSHALDELLQRGRNAALIVSYGSPRQATHLEWWSMYPDAGTVHFQNQLLFYEQLPRPFSLQEAFSFVAPRRRLNDDGRRISEWDVALAEVAAFAASMRG